MTDTIDSFAGEFEFLSNAFPSALIVNQELYATVEHAFQAAKTTDVDMKLSIREAVTASDAKRIGSKVNLIQDWDDIRVDVMASLVQQKFNDHVDLKIKLLMTGNQKLVLGNTRKDQFWGINKDGVGQNQLGQILMKVRDKIRATDGNASDVFRFFLRDKGLQFLNDDIENVFNVARIVVDDKELVLNLDQDLVDVDKTATFVKSFI